MRSFDPADFEGDLDAPWPGPPTPLFASAGGGTAYGDMNSSGLRGPRQLSLKGGTALILAAFVVLYGGAVLLHRYDQASPTPTPHDSESTSQSVEGSIASNGSGGSGGSNFAAPSQAGANGGLQAPAAVARNGGSSGPANAPQAGGQPPSAKVDDSVPPDMSIANLPPPVTSAAPSVQPQPAAPSATTPPVASGGSQQSQAQAQQQPQPQQQQSQQQAQQPSQQQAQQQTQQVQPQQVQPQQVQPQQVQPVEADNARGRSYARSHAHERSNAARASSADAIAAQAQAQARTQQQLQQKEAQLRTGRASVSRTLDGAQAQLAKSDLRGAGASLSRVLAADPSNGYALSLRDQLASREAARDASLNAARACVVQSRWHCVWHNAGAALSVDASSTEAKALVDRAIVESGAATAPAGPGPDNVEVPMVQ